MVELWHAKRRQALRIIVRCVGSAHQGAGDELCQRDMVRVAVVALQCKRDYNLRANAADMRCNFADDLLWFGLIHIAIDVIEKRDLAQAEMLRGTA